MVVAGAVQQPAYNPSQSGFFGGGNHQTNSRVELFRTDPAAARQEALKLAVGHRPALRKDRLSLIATVVRSGLRA